VAVTAVVDTNVALLHLAGKLDAPLPTNDLLVSVVTEPEMLSYRALDADSERAIRIFLERVRVIDLTPPIKEATVRFRRQHGLKLPDPIIAATAQCAAVDLLTNDARLLKIPDLRARSMPQRP